MTESPGKFLKGERETRNISLEQISHFTKIKERHLKAIEEDRYELLPPALYVKGYLNGYARYLDLNPKEIISQYENYLKSLIPPEPVELQHQVLPPRKRLRPWFFLSLILAAILFTLFLISYPGRHVVEEKPKPISLSSIPAIQQGARAQPIYRARQEGLSEPEKTGVNPPAIRYGSQGFASPRAAEASPSRASESNDSLKPQAEGGANLAQSGVAPERHRSAPMSAEHVRDVETEESPGLRVLEASIGKGIEKESGRHSLIGKCSEFTSNNQKGYFFTRIETPTVGKITHIWLWEGKEYYQMEIDVKPPAWSVYSYFTFRPQHAGNWKAEARNGDQVLTSVNFKVVQPTGDGSL